MSILDLDVLMYPCPKGGPTFRQKVLTLGGKQQFPYMIDPNTKVAMYESDNIIQVNFILFYYLSPPINDISHLIIVPV